MWHRQLWVQAPNLQQCLWTHLQVHGSKRLGCHAYIYTVSRCHTKADITRSSKQGYQWPHENHLSSKNCEKKHLSPIYNCALRHICPCTLLPECPFCHLPLHPPPLLLVPFQPSTLVPSHPSSHVHALSTEHPFTHLPLQAHTLSPVCP